MKFATKRCSIPFSTLIYIFAKLLFFVNCDFYTNNWSSSISVLKSTRLILIFLRSRRHRSKPLPTPNVAVINEVGGHCPFYLATYSPPSFFSQLLTRQSVLNVRRQSTSCPCAPSHPPPPPAPYLARKGPEWLVKL